MAKKTIPMVVPSIDLTVLQDAANKAAMKGAISVIDEYYSGWKSPYKEALENDLKSKSIDTSFTLPDILAQINDALTNEINTIANTAVAKTFLPMVKRMLTREDPNVPFSKILKEFIAATDFDWEEDDPDDYHVELISDASDYKSFKHYEISCPKISYDLALFLKTKDELQPDGTKVAVENTTCYTLPRVMKTSSSFTRYSVDYSSIRDTMKISLDGATLEMPFTKNVLTDSFISMIARLIIGDNNIIMDVTNFSEDLFPERTFHC